MIDNDFATIDHQFKFYGSCQAEIHVVLSLIKHFTQKMTSSLLLSSFPVVLIHVSSHCNKLMTL